MVIIVIVSKYFQQIEKNIKYGGPNSTHLNRRAQNIPQNLRIWKN